VTLKVYPDTNQTGEKIRSFTFNGRRIVVDEVIDCWHEAEYQYLKLLADDERIYLLRHRESNRWEVKKVYSY
jgi:hypothetical protein